MGIVYLARDTSLYRDVAIKIPHAGEESEQVHREAQLAAKLRHAHICPVYEVGEQDGVSFIAMAYIEGPTLAKWLEAFGPLAQLKAARLTAILAAAVCEAHRHGVVHRDLKPTNVLIDRGGEPLVTDFGLATINREPGSGTSDSCSGLLGTPMYMSPEQAECRHADVGPRSDIFSLGVILYEMLTGRPPFQGTASEVMTQIATCDPEPPSKHCPGLASELERICLTMMARRVDQRYATMQDVADALERFLRRTGTNDHAATPGLLVEPVPVAVEQSTQLVPRPAPDSPKATAAAPDTDSSRHGTRRRLLFVMLAAAAVWLGVTLLIRTSTGTLRIVVDDPTLQVEVDDSQIAINGVWEGKKWPGEHRLRVRIGGQELRLDAPVVLRMADGVAEYRLSVQLNGAALSSNEFEVLRGRTTVLKITHQATVLAQLEGDVVVEHVGSRRPTTEGWRNLLPPDPLVCEGPLEADGPTMIPAWYIDDNAGYDGGALCYQRELAPAEVDAAVRGGWVLRARLRVVDVPSEVSDCVRVSLFDGRRYWALLFGSETNGDPVVRLPEQDRGGPSVTVAGSGYHLYELRYDPQTDAATLFVDGAKRIGTFAGQEWPVAPSVRWGSGDSQGRGQGNYNLVQFEVLRDGE